MHRWVDHTAEVELFVSAGSPCAVLGEALVALGELLDAAELGPVGERRAVAVEAPDSAGLLAAWLEELVYLAESQGFVGGSLDRCAFGDGRVETVVAGRLGAPRPVVKAVTYHRLAFEGRDDGYEATVVFDV